MDKKLVHLLSLAALCAAMTGCEKPQVKAAAKEAPVVSVTVPITEKITDFEDFTGQTAAVYSVEVRARVTGYLDKVHFVDGAEVKEGDLLFEIDPRPYQADLNRNEATVVQSEAHLKRLEADFHRAENLYKRNNISREEFDKIAGDRAEAEAAVGIARASLDLSKLNVQFTKIVAPISGRLSRRLVDPGNLVKADDTSLTTIVSLDPIFIYFDIDERTLLRVRRLIGEGKVKSREEAEVKVLASLSDEEGFPHVGSINFSDNRVDPNTGTLRIRASIPNPKPRVLSPGLFVRVRVPIGVEHEAILVPEQAVGTDQGRKFVYVVDAKNKVLERTVEVGPQSGTFRVIQSGLKPTERVVYRGLQRIRPGVIVNPELEEVKPKGATSPVAKAGDKSTPTDPGAGPPKG